jgi:hypothetical protein
MTEETIKRRWYWRVAGFLLSPVVGGPVAVVILVLAGLLMYRQSRLTGIPDIGDPFDLETVAAMEEDPADNAHADYEAAVSMLNRDFEPDYKEFDAILSGHWEQRTPECDQWLRDNEPALERWRQGTERAAYQRAPLKELTVENALVSVADSQTFCRLATLKGLQAESAGDLDGAWHWHRAHFRFCRHVGMFGPPIERMLGAALHAGAADAIVRWAADDRLNGSQLAAALANVRRDYELTPPHSVRVLAEYFVTMDQLNRLQEVADAHRQVEEFVAPYRETFRAHGVEGRRFPSRFELLLANEPELTRRLLRHQVANLLTFIDQPRNNRPATLSCEAAYYDSPPTAVDQFLEPDRFEKAVDGSALAKFLLMKVASGGSFTTREEARQGMLETILAAEQYRRVHGVFPVTIGDLVEADLIDEVPTDPTSPTGDPMRFERNPYDPQRAKVWTVGLNGFDDGGNLEVIPGEGPADMGYSVGTRASDN